MLKKLYIQNYAIIDEIEIDFSPKLNIITGETGAGKSILMGALSLILGDRADSGVLMNREKKCFVEGIFSIDRKIEVKNFFRDNDLDADEEVVIRREINTNGKSRAFVNDTPVNLDQLRELSSMLVDLHRQFDSLALGESNFQREVVDALAGNTGLLQNFQSVYHRWLNISKELNDLQEQKNLFTKEYDYNKFLFDELQEAAFKENELEEVEDLLKMLTNSEGIKSVLSRVSYDLQESDHPIVQQLRSLQNQMSSVSSFHPDLEEILKRMHSTQVELQDIAGEVDRINQQVNYDPKEIDRLNERLSTGYKLLKKHGLKTTHELLSLKSTLAVKLQAVLDIDYIISEKQKEVDTSLKEAEQLAARLSENRKRQIKPLQEKVNKLLVQVGMPNARLRVDIHDQSFMQPFGKDAIEFLFDANKSNRFESIRKVASGGELSRLMLSIKSLVAESIDLSTMIFDEIDSVISGEAAKQVGIIMKKIALQRQVISITHQPQIAGKADAHFFVYKEIKGEAIKTSIRLLDREERITTIAKMLSGEKPTAAALENAREMVLN